MTITKEMIEAAAKVFNDNGLPISLPWKGDLYLDDVERERFEALKSALEAAERAAWQPIETAPKDGTKVDLWCQNPSTLTSGGLRLPDCHYRDGRWLTPDDMIGYVEVHNATHWRPLPSPPEKT